MAGEELLVGLKAVGIFGTFAMCVWVCVCARMHVCLSLSARGGAMFHLVNITRRVPPLYSHHHRNWQLAGSMQLQLPCFGQKKAANEMR